MRKNLKLFRWISNMLFTAVILAAITMLLMYLMGIRTFVVLSGSMEPAISTGSLLYVQPVDYRTLDTGDIITFQKGEKTTVTHRIVSVIQQDGDIWFQTKGDSNDIVDGNLTHWSDVIGRLLFFIPTGGYVVHFLRSTPVCCMAVSIGAFIVYYLLIPNISSKKTANNPKGKYLSN